MIQIIFSIIIILAMVFVFALDGDKSKIPFLNKSQSRPTKGKSDTQQKKKASSEDGKSIKGDKKIKKTQEKLPFKKIKSSAGTSDRALLVQEDNTYIGVAEIYGINYNLLSLDEKLQLESVFQMVLNGLDYPVQLFIQSRNMDIDNYNNIYKKRIDELKELEKTQINKIKMLEKEMDINSEEIEVAIMRVNRLKNQIEYGENVIRYINNIAYSSDILDKKYYFIIKYKYDKGMFNQEQNEDERFVTAFNTISNRLESILSGLGRAGLEGKFLNGIELAELLYTSFNKEESNKYKIVNALNSGFANYITTSRPVEHKILENEEDKLLQIANELK